MTPYDNKVDPSDSSTHLVPAWMLAPHEEKEVLKRTQEKANEKCAKVFFDFGDCCKKHQLFFSWKCADQKKAMIQCVEHWGTQEKYLEQRDLYIEEKELQMAQDARNKGKSA